MMGKFKQIKISTLKSLIIVVCIWNTKKFCKSPVGAPIQVLNHSKWIKIEEDMGLKLERNLELFFSKILK